MSRAKCSIQTIYILHDTILETVTSAKYLYLGVAISDDLSWSRHIDSISKKANQTLWFLKRIIKVLNKDLVYSFPFNADICISNTDMQIQLSLLIYILISVIKELQISLTEMQISVIQIEIYLSEMRILVFEIQAFLFSIII